MKFIFSSLLFCLLFTTAASANHEVIKNIKIPISKKTKISIDNKNASIAAIYLDKFAIIKKTLSFEYKATRPKLA